MEIFITGKVQHGIRGSLDTGTSFSSKITGKKMVSLFIAYSGKDEDIKKEFDLHLEDLKMEGKIEFVYSRKIEDMMERNENFMNSEIILLLVSPDFIESEYCYSSELSRILDRNWKAESRVIPVILRACDWFNTPLGKLIPLPAYGRPVNKFQQRDEAFSTIVSELRRIFIKWDR